MGGGGFSMEPDNPLLDDHVLDARPGRPAGGIGRGSASWRRPVVTSPTYIANFYDAFARRAGGEPPLAVRPDRRRHRGLPARPGRRLRRRRQHGEHARDLARPRRRSGAAAGLGGGDRHDRACRPDRCAGSRPGRPIRSGRAWRRCRAGSASCRAATPRTTTARRPGGRTTSGWSAEGVLPAGYAADDGAALVFHGGGARRGRRVATGRAGVPRRARPGRRRPSRPSLATRYLG